HDSTALGWIGDGSHLIECVIAANLLNGELSPCWRATPSGARLVHRRYTLSVEKTCAVWTPKIVDELSGRSHTFKSKKTVMDAVYFLDDLLRRLVGRRMPPFDPDGYFEGYYPLPSMPNQLRLALEVMGPNIGE